MLAGGAALLHGETVKQLPPLALGAQLDLCRVDAAVAREPDQAAI